MDVNIVSIPALKDNYIHTLIVKDRALVIDPGEAEPVIRFLQENNLHLNTVFITHHHADHTQGIKSLCHDQNIPVYGRALDKITVFAENFIDLPSFHLRFEVLPIPGHTLDHVAYYCSSLNILFTGDTLFTAGCGRAFEGTYSELFASLQKLNALPRETQIYSGHEYALNNLRFAAIVEPGNITIQKELQRITKMRQNDYCTQPSTLLLERKINPFLRCEKKEIIKNIKEKFNLKTDEPLAIFTALREWKNNF